MSKPITIQFRLTGLIPSKKNNQQVVKNKTTGRLYIVPSYKYAAWNRRAIKSLTKQAAEICERRKITFPISTSAALSIKFFFKDMIRRDLTNKAESLQDTLKDAKIIIDDSWTNLNPVTLQAVKINAQEQHCDLFITFSV